MTFSIMRTWRNLSAGYTLVELMVATALGSLLLAGLVLFSSTALRLISRNFATNHGHDAARGSFERMVADLHNAASTLSLVSFDGTTYSDVSATVSADQDPYTGQYLSTRANGVKFLKFAGGPYKLIGDAGGLSPISPVTTTVKFEFGPLVNGKLPYVPAVGDKLQLPLISREFDITAVPTPPTAGITQGTVTLSIATGFTLYTSGTTPAGVVNPITTGYFYKHYGYTVWGNQLRYHATYPPAASTDTVMVRNNVTSPKPFSLLFLSSTSALSDNLNLRVSLEAYDLYYGARFFQNGTTTIQAVIPSRTQPPPLTTN